MGNIAENKKYGVYTGRVGGVFIANEHAFVKDFFQKAFIDYEKKGGDEYVVDLSKMPLSDYHGAEGYEYEQPRGKVQLSKHDLELYKVFMDTKVWDNMDLPQDFESFLVQCMDFTKFGIHSDIEKHITTSRNPNDGLFTDYVCEGYGMRSRPKCVLDNGKLVAQKKSLNPMMELAMALREEKGNY